MKFDAFFPPETELSKIAGLARAAEETGFDGVWMAETQHNPFLPGVLAAEHTQKITFGTGIAVSFARSPAVMAHTAWDLAELSGGRFILGLGTQVKPHIERRFGLEWPASPVKKLREQIAALRAFWRTWQHGDKLNQRGEYYKVTLTSPFFTPAPISHPEIPIYIAGVNTGLARLAGEAADGFHIHPFHTAKYLEEILLPAVETGAQAGGRSPENVSMVANVFVATSDEEREIARQQISFYASTPSYRSVLALHGWEDVGERLSQHAARQEWELMPALVNDTILETVAVIAAPLDLAAALMKKYHSLADRLTLYMPFIPGERDGLWQTLRNGIE